MQVYSSNFLHLSFLSAIRTKIVTIFLSKVVISTLFPVHLHTDPSGCYGVLFISNACICITSICFVAWLFYPDNFALKLLIWYRTFLGFHGWKSIFLKKLVLSGRKKWIQILKTGSQSNNAENSVKVSNFSSFQIIPQDQMWIQPGTDLSSIVCQIARIFFTEACRWSRAPPPPPIGTRSL